ncbi:hypothetical protein D3C86_2230430 [compost metagenome]
MSSVGSSVTGYGPGSASPSTRNVHPPPSAEIAFTLSSKAYRAPVFVSRKYCMAAPII